MSERRITHTEQVSREALEELAFAAQAEIEFGTTKAFLELGETAFWADLTDTDAPFFILPGTTLAEGLDRLMEALA